MVTGKADLPATNTVSHTFWLFVNMLGGVPWYGVNGILGWWWYGMYGMDMFVTFVQ